MNNKKFIFKVKIGNYKWSIRFLPPDLMRENEYGTCWSLKRAIDIDASLDKEEAKIILGHELSHAFLTVAGKLHNKDFDEEEVCDFITWNIDQIISIRDYVLKERFENGKTN